MRVSRLFGAYAQVRPRGTPRFCSLCAGQLRRWPSCIAIAQISTSLWVAEAPCTMCAARVSGDCQ
jgi:hypothetical protein